MKRQRGESFEYSLKVVLSQQDKGHLEKLVSSLDSNIPVSMQKLYSGFGDKDSTYPRVLINRKHLSKTLYDEYGLIPNRNDIEPVVSKIKDEFLRDFLRGVFDADGTILSRDIEFKKSKRKEFSIGLSTCEELVKFFNYVLIKEGLTKTEYRINQRHEGRDGYCRSLRITGNNIVEHILDWLYGNSNISLNRKYCLYVEIKQYMNEYREEKVRYES